MRLLSLIGASILVIIINIIVHSLINKKEESEDENPNSTSTINTNSSTKLTFKETIFSKFRKDKQHYLFAIELAIIVALSEFIAIYFKIPTAKWLSFTAIGILRPNTNLVTKGFKKIEGTIIGVIGFILIDILILRQGTIGILGLNVVAKDIALLLIVIFSYFYTMYYLENKYVIRMVFSTLLALSIAFISIPQINFITDRIVFIIIGAILCIIINYSMRQSTKL
ncbi:MAG: FUSC family protein [archaeon]|nr:FUSC family protein [archaeon]